nr:TetR/AcrR family transcriptional regulator [Streptomyces clavuligerus]
MASRSTRSTQILEAAARVIARRGVRGLRVEELAAEAGVSTALIYYHFKDRTGVLRQTFEFINDRAARYTAVRDPEAPPPTPREELEEVLLLELQDDGEVRENSVAWGELRASAVFEEALREDLARATLVWVQDVAALLGRVQPLAPASSLAAAAERLTAYVELYLPRGPRDPHWTLWLEVWNRSQNAGDEARVRQAAIEGAWHRDLAALLAEGVSRGEFRSVDPDRYATRLRALLDGFSVHVAVGLPGAGRERALAHVAEFLVTTLLEQDI